MENSNKKENIIIETYADDLAKALENNEGGVVKNLFHEEEVNENEKIKNTFESKKSSFFLFFSFLCVILAFVILFIFVFKKNNSSFVKEKEFSTIIFNDETSFLEIKDFKKNEIIQSILNEIQNTELKDNEIHGIYLTLNGEIVKLRSFLEIFKSSFFLTDTDFVNDDFLFGVVQNKKEIDQIYQKDFFILIKMRSFVDIFDKLKSWENKMFSELYPFFNIKMSAMNEHLLTQDFTNGFVKNKNTRILYNKFEPIDKNIALMYVFADDDSLIITNSINATEEIMNRLSGSRVKK